MADPDFRCAAASVARGDDLAGSASTVRSFLLLEHAGPWGVEALHDARLPDSLGATLAERAGAAGVRALLVRRTTRAARSRRPRIVAARAAGAESWAEATEVDDLRDVLDLDLAALGAGRSVGLAPHPDPVLAVCTHGRHDACCAELGRPAAQALAEEWPEAAWECSHIGGDRFAANALVLPHGLYYGRLEPDAARRVARAARHGRLVLDHLRGRSDLPMPVQAAEIALRRRLGEDRLDAVVLRSHSRADDVVRAAFDVDGRVHESAVRVSRTAPAQLTCRAARPGVGWRFDPV